MKKKCIAGFIIALFLVFTGCEAGLVTDDGSGDSSGSDSFSFSDMYARLNKQRDEIELLLSSQETRITAMETTLLNVVPLYQFTSSYVSDNYYSTNPTPPWTYAYTGTTCYVFSTPTPPPAPEIEVEEEEEEENPL